MSGDKSGRGVFWPTVLGALAAALAAYYAFESSVPDCGPPRNTTLGRVYWLVPLALLIAQTGVVALSGRKTRRSPSQTIVGALLAAVIAVAGGAAIFLHFFAVGHCGE